MKRVGCSNSKDLMLDLHWTYKSWSHGQEYLDYCMTQRHDSSQARPNRPFVQDCKQPSEIERYILNYNLRLDCRDTLDSHLHDCIHNLAQIGCSFSRSLFPILFQILSTLKDCKRSHRFHSINHNWCMRPNCVQIHQKRISKEEGRRRGGP